MKTLCVSFALIVSVFASGCCVTQTSSLSESMSIKAAALRRISAAVESVAQDDNPPLNLTDSELIAFSTAHKPVLREGFDNYVLKAKIVNKHSIVLMCDAAGKRALAEDAGCTGGLDRNHWENATLVPCEFTINIIEACN